MDTRTSRTLRKKCPYSELFWSVFSGIWTECGYIRSISPHSVWMRENTNQNNSEYEDFTVPYLSRALFALFLFVRSSVSSQRRISELAHLVHKKRKVTELWFWEKTPPVKISQKVHKNEVLGLWQKSSSYISQPAITCSKLAIETLEERCEIS